MSSNNLSYKTLRRSINMPKTLIIMIRGLQTKFKMKLFKN